MRRRNVGRLLRLVHVHGATSRSELTAQTGLNRSTVRALTSDLARVGLVRESAPVGHGGVGRPSISVWPRSEQVFVLAVDIGVEHLVAARVGLGGVVLGRRRLVHSRGSSNPGRALRALQRTIQALLAAAPADAVCIGIGVGVCGVVRAADGLVRSATNLGWVDVPLGELLSAGLRTPVPVSVGNNAGLGALAEHVRGAGRGFSDLVYLAGDVGIGGGVILGGQPLTGAGGYAGEIGHMSVNPRGRCCPCGRHGCWETEVGEDALMRAVGAPPRTSLGDLLAAHAAGDPRTRAGIRRVGRWLGRGVADLVNIFNPQVVIFGGETRSVFPLVERYVRAGLEEALSAPREQVRLLPAGLGADSTVLGAAELAFAPLLSDPLGALSAAHPRSA